MNIKKVLTLALVVTVSTAVIAVLTPLIIDIIINKQNKDFVEVYHKTSASTPADSWNIPNQGRYDFLARSKQKATYTEHRVTVGSSYAIDLTNKGKYPLYIEIKDENGNSTSKYSIPSGSNSPMTVSNENPDVTSELYIVCKGKFQNYSGYIMEYNVEMGKIGLIKE